MRLRASACARAVAFTAGVLCANVALAQPAYGPSLYELHSIEWLVADAAVVVRGVIAEVADRTKEESDMVWSVVTLDVRKPWPNG